MDYHHMPEEIHGWRDTPVVYLLAGETKHAVELFQPAFFYSKAVGRMIELPKLFRSDLLSVPWWIRWRISSSGPGRQSGLLHDFLVDPKYRPDWCSSKDACNIFEEALRLEPVSSRRRRKLVGGVKIGGPRFDRINNGE